MFLSRKVLLALFDVVFGLCEVLQESGPVHLAPTTQPILLNTRQYLHCRRGGNFGLQEGQYIEAQTVADTLAARIPPKLI